MSQPNIAPDGNGNITPSYQDTRTQGDPAKWYYSPNVSPMLNAAGPYYSVDSAPIDWPVQPVTIPPASEAVSGLSATATFLQRFGFGNYNPPTERST